MKNYYAVQFLSGRNTTTGQPNPTTGRCSKAVHIHVFDSFDARNNWVADGEVTSAMRGNCREAVTKRELRGLKLGMTLLEFEEHLSMLEPMETF